MDVTKEMRKSYVALLATGGVTAYDRFLPDTVPSNTYVVITSQEDNEQLDKCDNGHLASIQLDVTHRTTANSGGIECDDVADDIIVLVKGEGFILPPELILIQGSTRKTSDNTLDGFHDTYRVYRRILRFQHIIKKN